MLLISHELSNEFHSYPLVWNNTSNLQTWSPTKKAFCQPQENPFGTDKLCTFGNCTLRYVNTDSLEHVKQRPWSDNELDFPHVQHRALRGTFISAMLQRAELPGKKEEDKTWVKWERVRTWCWEWLSESCSLCHLIKSPGKGVRRRVSVWKLEVEDVWYQWCDSLKFIGQIQFKLLLLRL